MKRSLGSTRALAGWALVFLATFPAIVVALNLVQQDDYHPVKQAISELALGRGGWLMAIAFCAIGTGILLVAILIRRTVANSRAAPALLAVAALLGGPVSAVFHTDLTGAKTTTHGQIHNMAGLTAFVLVIVAMFVSSRRFRRDPAWQRFARPTLAWALGGVGTFFLIPLLGNGDFGLAQRIFVATWLTWLLTVAAYTRKAAATAQQPGTLPRAPREPAAELLTP